MNILAARRYVRFTPFDTSTEQGRGDERYRLAMISILTNVLSRSLGMIVMILSVRLTVPYLGVERFGIWMTVSSFAGLLSFLDLGVGNALTNHVAKRAAEDNPSLLRQTISGGLTFLALVGALMGIGLWCVAAYLPWSTFIKVTQPELLIEARSAAMCFALLFGISIFTTGLQRIFAGLQKAYVSHMVAALGSLTAGIGIWLAATAHADISTLLIVMLGSQSAVSFILFWILIHRKQLCFKNIVHSTKLEIPHLYHTGWLFFVLQIGTMVGWGADSLIISGTLGATQVAVYSITQRLFQFVSQPLALINAPLWSAYADAHARDEKIFISKTLRKSMLLTMMGSILVGLFILVFSSELIVLWTRSEITVPTKFVFIFFVWTTLEALGNAFAMFLNGCNVIRPQVVTVVVLTCIALPTKIYFVNKYGISGMLLSYTVVYFSIVVFMYGIVYRNKFKEYLN